MSRTRSRGRLSRLLPSLQPSRPPAFPSLRLWCLLKVLLPLLLMLPYIPTSRSDSETDVPSRATAAAAATGGTMTFWNLSTAEPTTSSNESRYDELPHEAGAESEPPFAGFEGSQKFPMKPTHKPLLASTATTSEKFDRRHFKPPKSTESPAGLLNLSTTAVPDLPKSPSREVIHRRKPDGSDDDDDDIDELEGLEDLPGMLPGQRSAAQAKAPATTITTELTDNETLTLQAVNETTTSARLPTSTEEPEEEYDAELEAFVDDNFDSRAEDKTDITILGLFELTQANEPRPEGPSELQAAKLAVERINQMGFLPRFNLRLVYNDTEVSRSNNIRINSDTTRYYYYFFFACHSFPNQ